MELLTGFVSVAASLAVAFGAWVYVSGVRHRQSEPNAVAWIIWTGIEVLNMLTFSSMGDWDWRKVLPLTVSVTTTAVIMVEVWRYGKRDLAWRDTVGLAVGVAALLVWAAWSSASFANLVLQVARLDAFALVFMTMRRHPGSERPKPWLIWFFNYLLMTTLTIACWHGVWEELAYPLSGIVLNGTLATFAWRQCRKA